MKDKRFLFGLLVIALAFAMTVAGCENDLIPDPKLNGTWVYEYGNGGSSTIKYNSGNYEDSVSSTVFSGVTGKGTYTTGSGMINYTSDQINGAYYAAVYASSEFSTLFQDKWYSLKEYKDIMKSAGLSTTTRTKTTYQVSGNTLTLTHTYTKDSDGSVGENSSTFTKR